MADDELELDGKSVLILVGEIYEDLELWYPRLRLEEAGAEVTVAGPEASVVYLGKNGYPCKSEASIPDMKASEFDALVVPGGFMPDKLRRDPVVLNLVRDLTRPENPLLQSVMAAGFRYLLVFIQAFGSQVRQLSKTIWSTPAHVRG